MCGGTTPYCGPGGYCVACLSDTNCTAPRGVCTNNTCTCDAGLTQCGGNLGGPGGCFDLQTDANHCGACSTQCQVDEVCAAGKCGCPAGGEVCNGVCVDLSNPLHCGSCAKACTAAQSCQAGKCQTGGCTGGLTACNRACVDTKTDFYHCGACGTRCNPDQACVAGKCQ
jgi:hypothetical protein